jgi:hypothetical protein
MGRPDNALSDVVGEETPDEGAVSVSRKLTIGYFREDVEEMQGRSVLDEAGLGFKGVLPSEGNISNWGRVGRLEDDRPEP